MDRRYTATGGYAGGSMGESTPNRGDRLFSLAVSFVLPSFSLSPLASLSLSISLPSRGELPARACTYLRLPTLVLPRCTCRAHESVERGGRIKLQPGERVLGKVEATLNPFISRTSVLRIRLRIGKRNTEGKGVWGEKKIIQRHRRSWFTLNFVFKEQLFEYIFFLIDLEMRQK